MLQKPNKDPKFPLNFRPISLISSIAKIYEKVLLTRIQQHTTDNNIVPDFQHGFRKETSTCHQLLRVANKIIHGFNHSTTTGGLFLDVEKAFDRLWHNGLIYKMINLHFPDYLIHTLADYLNDRTFQIRIDATISRTGQIQAGCPQGSNLSPILYNIYTHDFPTSPEVEICLFADDAAIIKQAASPPRSPSIVANISQEAEEMVETVENLHKHHQIKSNNIQKRPLQEQASASPPFR
ncbi:probable RNA-directed DNA polymerase from transposon X-element [Trichonephila clavipes]|nr:probable RNA-directed DNA polymerase from transposon X-element [Trichonephila clavipes]